MPNQIVVDTSALLAVLFSEPHKDWVVGHLRAQADGLRMSSVNLAEVLMICRQRRLNSADEIDSFLRITGIEFEPPTIQQVYVAAEARDRFPLNFGDCFAYALAAELSCPIITLDDDFRNCDLPVLLPPTETIEN